MLFGAAGLVLAALFVALRALGPEHLPGPDACLFHRFTGYACPACGLTRAAAALSQGRFAEAFRFHPLWPLVALEIAALAALAAFRAAGREWPRRAVSTVAVATAALFVAVWAARLVLGTLPP